MVDKFRLASRNTKRGLETAYEIVAMAAAIAAAVRVATLPKVVTGFGALPVWQAVAAILLAGIAFKMFMLLNKE